MPTKISKMFTKERGTQVPPLPPIINSQQLAQYLGLNFQTVSRMADRGEIPAFKIGRQWRFRSDEIDQWMRGREARKAMSEKIDHLWLKIRGEFEEKGYSQEDVPRIITELRADRRKIRE